MPINRFFTSNALSSQSSTFLSEEESHHALCVMRLKEGQTIEIIDGKGSLAQGQIDKVHKTKNKKTLQVGSLSCQTSPPPKHRLTLIQGACAMHKMEWIIEKATELGVTDIILYLAEASPKRELSAALLSNLNKKAVSALKQSGRLWLPRIRAIDELSEIETCGYLLDDQGLSAKELPQKLTDIVYAVGPEKGWSEKEKIAFESLGFKRLSINQATLRTETAAIFATGLFSFLQSS